MIVMKFGGSSLASAERLRRVAEIVKGQLKKKPALVLSAMGDTTDHLLEAAERALKDGPVSVEPSLEIITDTHISAIRELGLAKSVPDAIRPLLSDLGALLAGVSLIGELSPRSRDFLVSFGERLSVRIAALYFNSIGVPARAFDAWEVGFISDGNWNQAELLPEAEYACKKAVLPVVESGIMPVITGFIAKSLDNSITTLGRGGSDLSATFLGASCGAEEVQVWKDVDGILSADPRIVPGARPVPNVSYDEAAELAYFGSQVLHPRAMLPCSKSGTPVLVKNSYNPESPGTRITRHIAAEENHPVRALTSRRGVTVVDIISFRMLGHSGFLGEVFAAFARHKISVDMVATSEVSLSLTLDASYKLDGIKTELSRIANVEVKTDKAIVTVVCDIAKSSRILARTFEVCEKLNIRVEMISQGASKVNISFVVNDSEAEGVVRAMHKEFFERVF